ncbi:MAG: hypothetical protein JWL63_1859 [Rhodocyclales bacterium]|nr:hypothetical protein [Rhodocyclales bacterium]
MSLPEQPATTADTSCESPPAPGSVAARAALKAAFSADTPDEIRERVLDAVLAVLSGDEDD